MCTKFFFSAISLNILFEAGLSRICARKKIYVPPKDSLICSFHPAVFLGVHQCPVTIVFFFLVVFAKYLGTLISLAPAFYDGFRVAILRCYRKTLPSSFLLLAVSYFREELSDVLFRWPALLKFVEYTDMKVCSLARENFKCCFMDKNFVISALFRQMALTSKIKSENKDVSHFRPRLLSEKSNTLL